MAILRFKLGLTLHETRQEALPTPVLFFAFPPSPSLPRFFYLPPASLPHPTSTLSLSQSSSFVILNPDTPISNSSVPTPLPSHLIHCRRQAKNKRQAKCRRQAKCSTPSFIASSPTSASFLAPQKFSTSSPLHKKTSPTNSTSETL